MTNEKYDKLMLEALRLYKEQQLNTIPPENEIDYEFSEGFQKRAEKLIRKQERAVWQFFQHTGRKVAAVILALIIGLSATLSIDAVREPLFEFFYKIFSTHTEIEYDQNRYKKITEYYTLPEVPNSYKTTSDTFVDEYYSSIFWTNRDRQQINLQQASVSYNNSINSEDGKLTEMLVNGINTLFCNNGHSFICTWSEHGYYFELVYPSDFGAEYMVEVIGKLVPADDLNQSEPNPQEE